MKQVNIFIICIMIAMVIVFAIEARISPTKPVAIMNENGVTVFRFWDTWGYRYYAQPTWMVKTSKWASETTPRIVEGGTGQGGGK